MGNRAVITYAPYNENNAGIYVHWNGGRASVEAFLQACKELGYRDPASDPSYAMARLTQVISAFFPDGLSVGIGAARQLDQHNYDNGVYVIGQDWQIVGRMFNEGAEEINEVKTEEIKNSLIETIKGSALLMEGLNK
jgi:acylphosphatase